MIGTSPYMVVFRLVHILSGIFWVGAVAMFALFISPAAAELGPAAGPMLSNLVLKRRVVRVVAAAGATTILAGAFVYWHDWDTYGNLGRFLDSRFGEVLTAGALFAIAAFAIGVTVVLPGVEGAVRLGGEIARADGPPPPELLERMRALQIRNRRATRTVLVLLVVAAAAMATARAW
jgi:uncharacterized membrane protein